MVVVIDDRQDVWGDCPNLLKVVPCKLSCPERNDELTMQDEFFDGIGDINGTFLPPTPKAPSTTPPAPGSSDTSPTSTTEVEATSEEDGLLLQQKLMDDVSEARPLAKLQEQLESDHGSSPETGKGSGSSEGGDGAATDSKPHDQDPPAQAVRPRKPLLNNIDNELDRLSHVRFSYLQNDDLLMTRFSGRSIPLSMMRSMQGTTQRSTLCLWAAMSRLVSARLQDSKLTFRSSYRT